MYSIYGLSKLYYLALSIPFMKVVNKTPALTNWVASRNCLLIWLSIPCTENSLKNNHFNLDNSIILSFSVIRYWDYLWYPVKSHCYKVETHENRKHIEINMTKPWRKKSFWNLVPRNISRLMVIRKINCYIVCIRNDLFESSWVVLSWKSRKIRGNYYSRIDLSLCKILMENISPFDEQIMKTITYGSCGLIMCDMWH